MRFSFIVLTVCLAVGCGTESPANNGNSTANSSVKLKPAVPVYTYEILRTYPHDPAAFTQGLFFHEGFLYEGTGGKQSGDKNDPFFSSLRKVELQSGRVVEKHPLAPEYFGEGIALLNGRIFQLTWREGTAFVYELDGFKKIREFRYSGEGWGLTEDGTDLYMSDGTHVIRVVDPETFRTKRTIVVKDERGQPVMDLNELEWVKGEIWANVWQKGWVLRIDPVTGNVFGKIDFTPIVDEEQKANRKADVLNGIAYDEAGDRVFITGKLWRRLFEVKVVEKR